MLNVRRAMAICVLLLGMMLAAAPAFSQADFSGVWGARYQEDQPERIPGPALVDFLGLPMNDAARQWALSWDPLRLGLLEHQCQVHTAAYIYRGPLQLRIWEERDPETPADRRDQAVHQHLRAGTDDLDGRPSASLRQRAAHLDGLLDGRVERQHADGHDHAHQAGLAPAQRVSVERPHHAPRALRPARGPAGSHQHRPGSRLPGGAADQEPELRADHHRCRQLALAVRIRRRIGGSETGRGAALPARRESVSSRNSPSGTACLSTRRSAAPRRCIRSTRKN